MDSISVIILAKDKDVAKVLRIIETLQNHTSDKWEALILYNGTLLPKEYDFSRTANFNRRIKIINIEDFSISQARNIGIAEATSEWVLFYDLESNFFLDSIIKSLSVKIDEPLPDIILLQNSMFDRSGTIGALTMSGREYFCTAVETETIKPSDSVVLFRKQFLYSHNLSFCDNVGMVALEEFLPRALYYAVTVKNIYSDCIHPNANLGLPDNHLDKSLELNYAIFELKEFVKQVKPKDDRFLNCLKQYILRLRLLIREEYAASIPRFGKRTLFIVSSDNRSATYGVGTFVKSICPHILEYSDNTHLATIILSSAIQHPRWELTPEGMTYIMPKTINGMSEEETAVRICWYLKLMGEGNSNETSCLINDISGFTLAQIMRDFFSARIVLTYHYPEWIESSLNINLSIDNLLKLIKDNPYSDISKAINVESTILSQCDSIIVPSSAMADITLNILGIDKSRVFFVPHGIAIKQNRLVSVSIKNNLRSKYGFDPSDLIFLFCGRIDQIKGVFELISAFCEIKQNHFRLIIAGDGSFLKAMSDARQGNISNITFVGFASQVELDELYAISDWGVVPSYFESFGYSFLEMIANGLPVIARYTTGLAEISENYPNRTLMFHDSSALGAIFCDSVTSTSQFALKEGNLLSAISMAAYNGNNNLESGRSYIHHSYTIEQFIPSILNILFP